MERTIMLLICCFSGICITDCVPTKKRQLIQDGPERKFTVTKSNKMAGDADYEDQRKYEQLHHDGYKNKEDTFKKWPKMKYLQMKELCNIYVSKILPRLQKRVIIPTITSPNIPLIYRIIKDKNRNPVAPVKVSALQCYCKKSSVRKYFHFIRGSRPRCLFLIKPLHNTWNLPHRSKDMVIVNEVCEDLDLDNLLVELSLERVQSRTRKSRLAFQMRKQRKYEADSELQIQYERAHLDYYKLRPDGCRTWPDDMENVDRESLCKTFVHKAIEPVVVQESIVPEMKELKKLVYVNVSSENGKDVEPSIVTLLQCRVPKTQNIFRRLFRFVRAPTSNCVFLVKPIDWNQSNEFVIVNLFCDD